MYGVVKQQHLSRHLGVNWKCKLFEKFEPLNLKTSIIVSQATMHIHLYVGKNQENKKEWEKEK